MNEPAVSTERVARRYPVLIAGGGPTGLALAIELGWRGISCLVVEQGDGSVDFPTTNLVNTRTSEHLRRWGLADRVRYEGGFPPDYPRNYVFVTRMNGYEVARFDHPATVIQSRARRTARKAESGFQNLFSIPFCTNTCKRCRQLKSATTSLWNLFGKMARMSSPMWWTHKAGNIP